MSLILTYLSADFTLKGLNGQSEHVPRRHFPRTCSSTNNILCDSPAYILLHRPTYKSISKW
ncbi:MAG TPA: hypothetical protein VMX55_14380 [candidate division Zixibacteria bacterium]|nr:hypothetical protein [candidate division Zixibacteria bacterium]